MERIEDDREEVEEGEDVVYDEEPASDEELKAEARKKLYEQIGWLKGGF